MLLNRLKMNVLYNVVYQVLILIVPFITTPYVSRILLSEGLGTYSITTSIAKYFWMFALLGMTNYGNRTISKARDDRKTLSYTFWNLFYFQALTSAVMTVLYIAYLGAYGMPKYNIVALCQIPYVLSALFEVSWFFYGTEQFRFMVLRNTAIKILTTVAIFIFVKDQGDVWVYALINAFSLLMGQVCLWPFLLKQVDWVKPDWKTVFSHFKPNLVLFVSVVAVSIYTLMDKIMIELLSTRSEVGYYENTEKMMTMANGIVGAIGSVMLPRISYLMGRNDGQSVKNYLAKSMRYIMMLAIGISFGLAGIANEFSVVFFGEDFTACGSMIMVISLAVLFYSWENILRTQYLLPGNRDGIFVRGTVYAAVTNVILNGIFIPKLGALGAVIGTVGAQIAAAGYQSISVRRELPFLSYIKGLLPTILIGVLMFTYCRAIGNRMGSHVYTIGIQVIGGAAIFCLLNLIYMLLAKDTLVNDILKKIRRKRS